MRSCGVWEEYEDSGNAVWTNGAKRAQEINKSLLSEDGEDLKATRAQA